MGVVRASELHFLAGRPLSSPPPTSQPAHQVSDEEAILAPYIPAEGISAALVTPRRVLVTGGVLADDRVLPFTVLRYLDLDPSPAAQHAWTNPLSLRPTSKSGRARKRRDSAYPVCRMDQTLTYIPEVDRLFLIGGLKVGGKDECIPCKTVFSFDVKTRLWHAIDSDMPQSLSKAQREQMLGPRFAHTAVAIAQLPEMRGGVRSRGRKSAGYILVHGGYMSCNDNAPVGLLHVFDVRSERWSLRAHRGEVSPPQRAYHAAAVLDDLFVVHGGGCSDFYDVFDLSNDLYVFDLKTSLWVLPRLRAGSAQPPTPRRRHSIVNGIGKHEGALVLFGGHMSNNTFSNELFCLRLLRAQNGVDFSAAWEKCEVQRPAPLMPSSSDNIRPVNVNAEEKEHDSTAVAAGCMIAVPQLNKYLIIGGRSSSGMRSSPLLLDASEAEQLDRFQKRSIPLRLKMPVVELKEVQLPAAVAHPKVSAHSAEQAKSPDMPAVDSKAGQKRDETVRRNPQKRPRPSAKTLLELDHDLNPLLPSRNVSIQRNDETNQRDAVDVGGNLSPRQHPYVDGDNRYFSIQPQSRIKPASNMQNANAEHVDNHRSGGGGQGENFSQHGVESDEYSFPPVTLVSDEPEAIVIETPPSKRRRFTRASSIGRSAIAQDAGTEAKGTTSSARLSAGSDFVVASELAQRGKSKIAKSSRGRGRGRARSRAAVVAECRESLKRKEAEEALSRENARLLIELRQDNSKVRTKLKSINEDNKKLNDQIKSLLAEVQTLRPLRGALNASQVGTLLSLKNIPPGDTRKVLSNGGEVLFSQSKEAEGSQALNDAEAKIRSLQFTIQDLREECQDIGKERDDLDTSLKDVEKDKRSLYNDIHVLKNRLQSIETERETLRRQANELRTVAKTEMAARQDANVEAQKAEEHILLARRELETCRQELRDAKGKALEERHHLSNTQRQIATYRTQLAEATKRYNDFEFKERHLKDKLGSEQGKADELKQLAEETTVGKKRLEEKNVELLTELATLKTVYDKKLKDCDDALEGLEKTILCLDQERKKVDELTIENGKLHHSLQRTKRDCEQISSQKREKDDALRKLALILSRAVSEIDALTSSQQNCDGIHVIRDEIDASQEPLSLRSDENWNGIEVALKPANPSAIYVGSVSGRGLVDSSRLRVPGEGHYIADNRTIIAEGTKSPVPPSEDGDDVDEP